MVALCFANIGEKRMNDEMEQILKNQMAIMNVLYNMYFPTASQYHCGSVDRTIVANNGNRLIYNIEQTVNLLGRIHKEK